MNKVDVELLIDNAATASQNGTLIDDPVTREAIRLNVIEPLEGRIEELEKALLAVKGQLTWAANTHPDPKKARLLREWADEVQT